LLKTPDLYGGAFIGLTTYKPKEYNWTDGTPFDYNACEQLFWENAKLDDAQVAEKEFRNPQNVVAFEFATKLYHFRMQEVLSPS
uniref:C-type lectin domain-containing protein n=1 Tax=Gongylonema pulchrum TaxID=637853 RepID=A0A183ELS3_9BILA